MAPGEEGLDPVSNPHPPVHLLQLSVEPDMWVDMHRYFVEHNLPHEAIGDWLRSLIREELSR